MLNSCHVAPTQMLSPAMFFSIAFTQTTASKIGHFYFFPHPSPPAISFLCLLFQWKRTTNVGFFFFLKNFPRLCHHITSKNANRDGESPEAPSRETTQKTITLPLVVGVILHRCASLPGVWQAVAGTVDSPKETGLPTLCWWPKAGNISGTAHPRVPGSSHLPDRHEEAEVTSWWTDVEGHEHLHLKTSESKVPEISE